MHKFIFILLFAITSIGLSSQQSSLTYMYRVYLSDKEQTPFQIDKPEEFLSQRAIERRIKHNIAIDETDLPVSDAYISQITTNECVIIAKSKWLNTVSILCKDTSVMTNIRQLPFVNATKMVGTIASETIMTFDHKYKNRIRQETKLIDYGKGQDQAIMLGVDFLHEQGYRGNGIQIAVIDAGFYGLSDYNTANNQYFKTFNILGHKDFVYGNGDMFSIYDEHGTSVLSTMATDYIDNVDNNRSFVGTAPDAGYWILRSENIKSEYPIEEDYWVTAAEYADSLGVDLIHSSLGYYDFEYPLQSYNYTYQQMDGKTAFITLGAEQASNKGIFVVASMGNEGNKAWKYMGAPADGENVFSIGAVKKDSTLATFSSRGPTADGRIKPDAMALGSSATVLNGAGNISLNSGTSFSGPITSGAIACLWQAFPQFTNVEIAAAVRQSGNRYSNPNGNFGYGIPNMKKAAEILQNILTIKPDILIPDIQIKIKVDSSTGIIRVVKESDDNQLCNISVYTIDGRSVASVSFKSKEEILELGCNRNVYFVRIHYNNQVKTEKVYL